MIDTSVKVTALIADTASSLSSTEIDSLSLPLLLRAGRFAPRVRLQSYIYCPKPRGHTGKMDPMQK